jgi:nicotine blue oxidoreductase
VPPRAAGGRGSRLSAAALILAAGAGSRFGAGGSKLLADLGGRPVVRHVVDAALAARSVARIVVVVGGHAEPLRAALTGEGGASEAGGAAGPAAEAAPLEVVECEEGAQGQSASLRCGLRALRGCERVLVLVGDQPGVTAAAIERIARAEPGTRAAYGGRPGHPVLLGRELMEAAERLQGDCGLRDVAQWRLLECGDVATGDDVDTVEDLERLRGRAGGR